MLNIFIKKWIMNRDILFILLIFSVFILNTGCNYKIDKNVYNNQKGLVKNAADPFVLEYNDKYYMYTTLDSFSNSGIPIYKSDDLVNWSKPVGVNNGFALSAEDVWGNKWFWSGDVIEKEGKFYIYYTANEHLAVAVSNSPMGPFTQNIKKPLHKNINEIDASVFVDDNGKAYIYFVRFNNGNEIYVAELSDDMLTMKENTIQFCFRPSQVWEFGKHRPQAEVNEGAYMTKHNDLYYLIYTANHFRSDDYAVGYATSETPTGPWEKYKNNPILKKNKYIHGPGNGVIVKGPNKEELYFVYHTHCDTTKATPRKIAIDRLRFVKPKGSGPDIIEIDGPTYTDQIIPEKE